MFQQTKNKKRHTFSTNFIVNFDNFAKIRCSCVPLKNSLQISLTNYKGRDKANDSDVEVDYIIKEVEEDDAVIIIKAKDKDIEKHKEDDEEVRKDKD